ncbi:Hypothetical predicted protein [Mytilus galloprovincialis]|uniref:Uncharacterized protein n=1 Tax=Mytilus galloprovincialis TaxID=29158 RepID=A0A8B6CF65_MYTGA|nr:Hypothetical predicted protein [Mytilus galloprovincialis]
MDSAEITREQIDLPRQWEGKLAYLLHKVLSKKVGTNYHDTNWLNNDKYCLGMYGLKKLNRFTKTIERKPASLSMACRECDDLIKKAEDKGFEPTFLNCKGRR